MHSGQRDAAFLVTAQDLNEIINNRKRDFPGKGGITARFDTKLDRAVGAGPSRTQSGWCRTSRAKRLIPV